MKRYSTMFAYLSHHCMFLFVTIHVSEQACRDGWFGPGCRYTCHCSKSKTCDGNGTCPNNEACELHYFGPGCQYDDWVTMIVNPKVHMHLRDGNDSTCNIESNATSVEIILLYEVALNFFRIAVNDSRHVNNFTVLLNGGTMCAHERRYQVQPRGVDVTCASPATLTTLKIIGPISPYVCSVYITSGRNLALKESTDQTSVHHNNVTLYGSQNAVDGNTNPDLNSGSCTKTAWDRTVPWWRVNFTWPVILHLVDVFNRDGDQALSLNEFSMVIFTRNGSIINIYTGGTAFDSYAINLNISTPVSSIQIFQSPKISALHRYLTICEFEAFGDYQCPDGMYGLFCENTCTCSINEACHPTTGMCAPGCRLGLYGSDCLSQCSDKCASKICAHASGNCSSCNPGYFGSICETECPSNCEHRICDDNSGMCVKCISNYSEEFCPDCPYNYYGRHCNISCLNCANDTCHRDTGKCMACKFPFVGDFCKECPTFTYGDKCTRTCPSNCLDGVCDKTSGRCSECPTGYTGYTCGENKVVHAILITLLPAIAVFVLALFLTKRKTSVNESEHM